MKKLSKLHKNISISLATKMELLLICFVLFGWFKNGLYPVLEGFYSIKHLFLITLYPFLGFSIGLLFDILFKNKNMFSNRFYGLLFSILIPISSPLWIFIIFLIIFLSLNVFLLQKKDSDFHFVVFAKLILVFVLFLLNQYCYANTLEMSHQYVYSYLDTLLGFNESGMFTSFTIGSIISYILLCFDHFYKKEIPIYTYSFYILSLFIYSFWKRDMLFLLNHLFLSSILFGIVFLVPLSCFSPYTPKRKILYGVMIGILILPFSLFTNFHEGIYIAIILANFIQIFLNWLQKILFSPKKRKES